LAELLMDLRRPKLLRDTRGQSLIETALTLPLLMLLVLNVVNLGYFFLIVINLTAAARTATLYSIEGTYTPYGLGEPTSGGASPLSNFGTVAYTAYQDMSGALWNPTGATVQVCTQMNISTATNTGVSGSGTSQIANCETCTSGGCSAGSALATPNADPEAPDFVLNQVDIRYNFNTLFPGTIFNLPLQASAMCNGGSCTFSRRARMRSMGP
jgi:Flp pilus assembly protein TadG